MKYLALVLTSALFLFVSIGAVSANTEYKLTRIQYTASDGIRYDTARRNLHIIDSQLLISGSAFWMKAEINNTNYIPGDRDVFEKYRYKVSGSTLHLTDSKGRKSTATLMRTNPLRVKFDTGVIINARIVSPAGFDRNPQIKSLQTIDQAIDDVIANDTEIGPIGF